MFGRYRLLEVLRWGGIGTVYRAYDTMMSREVAIKVIPPELATEPSYQDRFRHEASIAARLNDPNIIPVYEAGEIDGRLYLVMPVVDGIDLQDMLRRDGPMSPELAVRVIEQAAAALEAAHTSGLVHSDVKPSNLFVVGGEFVYLIDFGVAAHPHSSRTATAHSDIYALTSVLYECLTGQPAGDGEPPKPTDIDSAIPIGFDDVIARGMAKNPDDRFQSARELATAARDALARAGTAVSPHDMDFGRYRLLELLGQGGMGSVYRAHDTELDRDVAVKVLQPGLATEPGYQERFRREAYAAGRLASPNIIPIYEAGEVDGRLYLVMPIIDGVDVHTVLERTGPMSPENAVRVVEQVAAALDTAHKAGLVHRDVKPSNLLMVGDEFVYLIDFGLVQEATADRLTRTNVAPGTPAYMAPERFTAGTIADARADVYSLAAVLYECLTAQLPFSGGGVEGMAVAHLYTEPPTPSSFDPAIPAGFDAVIARGMAKNPDDRYQSAAELAVAARAALTAPPGKAAAHTHTHTHAAAAASTQAASLPTENAVPSVATAAPTPRRGLAVAAALAVVVVIAVGAVWVLNKQLHPRKTPAQIVLPFADLDRPQGVAVDANGNVYVTDTGHNRVLELAAGSTSPTVAPFAALDRPTGIAVDNHGTVELSEPANNRVLELSAGSTGQTVLPFTDLAEPTGVAVYARGSDRVVYLADSQHNRVLALNSRSPGQTELPFSGLQRPSAVAVDSGGGLFVIDRENERVLKLPSTATVATVLPYAVGRPECIAVDASDDLYVTDSRDNRVIKLAKSSNTAVALPFTGLSGPAGVAVDSAGNVYVADAGNNRILKLPAS